MPRAQHLFQFDTDHLDEEEVNFLLRVSTQFQELVCPFENYCRTTCREGCPYAHKCKQIAHLKLLLNNRLDRLAEQERRRVTYDTSLH